VLSVADVADIVAYATAKYGEAAIERLPFAKAQRAYERVTARNVERRDAALLHACAAGAVSVSEVDAASSAAKVTAVEARLDDFIETEAAHRRPRPRLRLVSSQQLPTRPERKGVRPRLRLATSGRPVSPSRPTGRGR